MYINKIPTNQEEAFFETGFQLMLESHLTYLRTLSTNRVMKVSEHQCYKYEGDFYGLLNDLNVEKKYHYVIMRVNALASSSDFKEIISEIIVPDTSEIVRLNNLYLSKK